MAMILIQMRNLIHYNMYYLIQYEGVHTKERTTLKIYDKDKFFSSMYEHWQYLQIIAVFKVMPKTKSIV